MKKLLLLLLPTLVILGGCNKAPIDPYKVSEQEIKNALTFKNLSNFELDISYFMITDCGTHEEVAGGYFDYYFKDASNESFNLHTYNDIVTSVEKYQEYCQSKSIEYKESDFLAFVDYYENRGYKKTISKGIYTLKRERNENNYSKRINSFYKEVTYNTNGGIYRKVSEFDNYSYSLAKTTMFTTEYVNPSLFTYDENNKCYNIGEKSLGGIIYPIVDEEVRLDTYSISYANASFLNKNLNKIDMFVNGKHNQQDVCLSLTIEVKNINKVNYIIPQVEYEACDHEDKYWNQENDYHFYVCEDCDCYIIGSEGKCQYDNQGHCSKCSEYHTEYEILLSYDFFGYPYAVIERDYVIETNKTDTIAYRSMIDETEAFDYVSIPGDSKYYLKVASSGAGADLFYGCGSKSVVSIADKTLDYVFPETYTFETVKIEDEDKRVMVISKSYHDPLLRID